MRDYYRRASELYQLATRFLLTTCARGEARRTAPWSAGLRDPGRRALRARGRRAAGRAAPRARELRHGPGRGPRPERLAPARRARAAASVDAEFRTSREASRAFLRLFDRPGRVAPALRACTRRGSWAASPRVRARDLPRPARLLPPLHRGRAHAEGHRRPRRGGARGGRRARGLRARSSTRSRTGTALYLGMLLHDIGKGRGGGHVDRGVKIAERIVRRLGLDARRRGGRALPGGRAPRDVAALPAARPHGARAGRGLRAPDGNARPAEPAHAPHLRRPPRRGPRDLERLEGFAPLEPLRPYAAPPARRGAPAEATQRRGGARGGAARRSLAEFPGARCDATSRSCRALPAHHGRGADDAPLPPAPFASARPPLADWQDRRGRRGDGADRDRRATAPASSPASRAPSPPTGSTS